MSREAMKMALEALENCSSEHGHRCNRCDSEVDEGGKIAAALRAALEAPEAEAQPVAWRYKAMVGMPWSLSDDGYYVSCKRDKGYIVEPLYTVPPALVAELDEARRDIEHYKTLVEGMIVDNIANTVPPARVTLTDEQIAEAVRDADLDWHQGWTLEEGAPNRFTRLARAVERAHGITGDHDD